MLEVNQIESQLDKKKKSLCKHVGEYNAIVASRDALQSKMAN